jgi:hypothetical protein
MPLLDSPKKIGNIPLLSKQKVPSRPETKEGEGENHKTSCNIREAVTLREVPGHKVNQNLIL